MRKAKFFLLDILVCKVPIGYYIQSGGNRTAHFKIGGADSDDSAEQCESEVAVRALPGMVGVTFQLDVPYQVGVTGQLISKLGEQIALIRVIKVFA